MRIPDVSTLLRSSVLQPARTRLASLLRLPSAKGEACGVEPRIAVAQLEVRAGQPEENVRQMLRAIEDAKADGAQLIVFPEMSVGGYLLGDAWLSDAVCRELMRYNETLREASDGIAVAWGNVHLDDDMGARGITGHHPNKDGRARRYNAVYVAQDGKWAQREGVGNLLPPGVQPKALLPNYRFFEDPRYFFSLEDVAKDFNVPLRSLLQPFKINVGGKSVPVGFEVCEDMWVGPYRTAGKAVNPSQHLIDNGAKYLVNISASPWTAGKADARDNAVKALKEAAGDRFVPFVYVNKKSVQNNGDTVVAFDGGSSVYDRDAQLIATMDEPHTSGVMMVDRFNGPKVERTVRSSIEEKYLATLEAIRDLRSPKGEIPQIVIGLSGGVDSAVSAALLVKAVGKDRVVAVNMPTRYNSEKTKDAARAIADSLGIRYTEVPIESLVDENKRLVNGADLDGSGRELSAFNEENVQAKIRGTSLLSNLSAKYNGIFVNNGNKLELALGYATLYGDWGGARCILGDLTKPEVFEMARHLNKVYDREVVPSSLIPDELFRFREDQIAPAAELKEAQLDPMKFGYHDAILDKLTAGHLHTEDFLRWYKEGVLHERLGISPELMARWGVDDPKTFVEDLRWLTQTIHNSFWKRVQAPPVLATSEAAFGNDFKEAMAAFVPTQRQAQLEAELLAGPRYQPRTFVAEEPAAPARHLGRKLAVAGAIAGAGLGAGVAIHEQGD